MPINGLTVTDSFIPRRDGKIKSGIKDPATGYPKNLPHFALHDAPQLVPILGDKPTEIYFTVNSNNIQKFFRDDLRLYSQNQLVCKSMHNHVDPKTGQSMGSVAAFFKVGLEVPGLTANPFPGMSKAFERKCLYRSCPDYIGGKCSEHMFLDVIIPQYSMLSIFTLDNTSINAVMNALSAFYKAFDGYGGRLKGQIFRAYKKKVGINFPDKQGNLSKRDTDVVHIENINFADYEKMFRDKIDPVNWATLLQWRAGTFAAPEERQLLPEATGVPLLESGDPDVEAFVDQPTKEAISPTKPVSVTQTQSTDDAIRARANDPSVAPLFAEIALLLGKENSEENRFTTTKAFPDVGRLVTYLKGRIKELKKAAKAAPKAPEAKPQAAPTPPPPATPSASPLNSNPLF